jgi:diacylglycerol kinase (ATP)
VPPVVSTTTMSRDADRVAILVNPKAGPTAGQPRAERLAELLDKHGFRVKMFTDLAAGTKQANQWHAEGCLRTLVGVGGDGTAAELVNRTIEGVPLTLLPAGGSNLLAVYYHLSKDPEQVCRVIVEGVAARIDAGRANGRIFLIMIGCGFDAEVVNRVHERRTGHLSLTGYLQPVAKVLQTYEYPEMQARWEEENAPVLECGDSPPLSPGGAESSHQPAIGARGGGESPHSSDVQEAKRLKSLSARWFFVFNLPCYGGGFRIAPQSDGSDGLLDLCAFRRSRFWKTLATVVLRRQQRSADWAACRVRRLRITSDAVVPYQLDGDPGGWLPLDIEVLPARLTMLIPQEAVSRESAAESKRE